MTETNDTPEAAPVCYRHQDRETYVRCTRCDRPICPDCMNVAAVGFQCPDCVREGNKSVRQARTVFGGRAAAAADANVTRVLIGINVVAFVVQLADDRFTARYAMHGLSVAFGDYYRLVTSAFLHDPVFLLHIAFNMYALLTFGSQVERLLGSVRYLVLYLVAAIGGSVATMVFIPATASIGASGAVFGLFGAFFVLAKRLRADTSPLVVLIVINLAIGFVGRGYINNYAHIGGLVTGAAVAFVYTAVPRGRNQAALQFAGAAVIAAALAVTVGVKAGELRQSLLLPVASAATTSSTDAPSR